MEEEIEGVEHPNEKPVAAAIDNYHSNVDTSRPFRSVKEAVAIFGERFLVGDVYSPRPFSFSKKETPLFAPSPIRLEKDISWKYSSPSPKGSGYNQDIMLTDTVKKLETELEETKIELKLLKERESETEVALASLNAELHKNMSKLAQAEAVEAGKAAASSRSAAVKGGDMNERIVMEEEKKMNNFVVKKSSTSPSLAEILSMSESESFLMGRKNEKKVTKKKPIIPLLGDFFSRKKGSSNALHNPLYASSHLQWN